ncbi:PHP domain-containing protein [Mycoplasmatota bacterium]|nr:PHP domain-containing protein [Mycoplasmatota bacterium]
MHNCYYDLHIHSALSPCSSNDMTLNNIINMSYLKGLDIIAITDHNSAKNIEVAINISQNKDLIIIPGIEVETYEGIHMVCYFKTLEDIKLFDELLYQNIPEIPNKEDLWGQQLILDINDNTIDKEAKMLINSTRLKLNELIDLVRSFNGLIFTAHINRYSNSILTVLGFIPENIDIDGIEINANDSIDNFKNKDLFSKFRVIQNSDAHYLGDISEKTNSINLREKSIDAFFDYFRGEK